MAEAVVIRSRKKSRPTNVPFLVPTYRRPSRRGAGGGKRQLLVASIRRIDAAYRYREQVVPFIRMSGQWLERLGFRRGDRIEITEEPERLVLTVLRDDRELPIN
jgi:hypothetical protein